MAFVKIGPKVFKMGQEKGEDNDEPVHDVSITDSFCLGAFEVTQEQWSLVLGLQQPEEERRFLPASGLSLQDSARLGPILWPGYGRTSASWIA